MPHALRSDPVTEPPSPCHALDDPVRGAAVGPQDAGDLGEHLRPLLERAWGGVGGGRSRPSRWQDLASGPRPMDPESKGAGEGSERALEVQLEAEGR